MAAPAEQLIPRVPNSPLNRQRLQEALQLAESSFGLTEPNPRVGCILGREDGRLLGRGATQQASGPHVEVMALCDAHAACHELRGATARVTLKPCARHGRTPPCCNALIEIGLARVVVAVGDPFPKLAGEGIARLRAAGITVEMADADLAAAAREVNIGLFSCVERGRPFVRLKIAASLDGRTALPNGASQWFTGEAARRDGHAWRRRASAVLTGIGTVLEDDPRLDVCEMAAVPQPLLVILDSHVQTPPTARLFKIPERAVWIYCASADKAREATLRGRGADVEHLPDTQGKVDLTPLLRRLAERSVNELHVEAGQRVSGAL